MCKIACVILNYNDAERAVTLTEKIKSYPSVDHIILVDNHSTDDSLKKLQSVGGGKVAICQTDRNGGYGYGNNFGVRYAKEHFDIDFALITNPDVEFDEQLVERLKAQLLSDSNLGVVSALQLDRNGREVARSAWRIPPKWRYAFSTGILLRRWGENFYYTLDELHSAPTVPVDCVAGSLLMLSIPSFLKCGGYDEEMFLYCEETTLGCKMKENGFRTVLCTDVTYLHLHGVSIQKSVSSAVKRKRILIRSHRLVMKKYLKANWFERAVDWLVGEISILETALVGLFRKS